MENEFDLAGELDVDLSDVQPAQMKDAKLPKKAKPPKVIADEILNKEEEKPAKQKVRIMIDEVAGMSNYETVGVNGRIIQIKRGVPVYVDPEYVGVLENAVMTHTEKRLDRLTGETTEVKKSFSAIPWRRV